MTNHIRREERTDFLGHVIDGIYLADNFTCFENTQYKQNTIAGRRWDNRMY